MAGERFCDVGPVKLCYETFGDPSAPTLLLVMGLGTQMVAWHEDFCGLLVERGFHVVRFDNRDVGRSTHLDGLAPPGIGRLLLRSGKAGHYRLADMADDAAGLLDHLEVARAHVVGASMGGMIAQTLAARHPERVASLVSIMSTTGRRWVGQPRLSLYPVLLKAAPSDREAFVEHFVRVFDRIGSAPHLRDEATIREIAARSWERDSDPAGAGRQLGAIVASGDRTDELRRIQAPTLVIHGRRDPLVRPSGGRATARAIPRARLMEIDEMGHDLPRGLWPRFVDAIVGHARQAAEADLARAA